eukprot:COSAG06_NODE_576_length_14051_cov_5.354644_10_plen_582_part_00
MAARWLLLLLSLPLVLPAGPTLVGGQDPACQPSPSAASLSGQLSHWAHPLLRPRIFGHLGDASVDAGFTAALRAALRNAAEASPTRTERRVPRIELLEYGTGRWAVAAARWLDEQQRRGDSAGLPAPGPAVRLRVTVVAQEAVYAELGRATLTRNNVSSSSRFSVSVLHNDGGTWRGADGSSVELTALPKHDIVVCDGFGSPLDRLVQQATVLTALHRAGRLKKPFATIPSEVTLFAQAAQSDALRRRDRVPDLVGFSMRAFDKFVQQTARAAISVDMSALEWTALSEELQLGKPLSMRDPRTFYSVALSEMTLAPQQVRDDSESAQATCSADGRLDAVLVWAEEMLLPNEWEEPPVVLSTDPKQQRNGGGQSLSHSQWGQTAHFYRQGDEDGNTDAHIVAKGQNIGLEGTLNSDGLRLRIAPERAAHIEQQQQLEQQEEAAEAEVLEPWNAEDYVKMLNDSPRNEVYDRAVAAAVRIARDAATAAATSDEGTTAAAADSASPRVHVLDIGSGEGLLSLAAARAGADRVTALEINPSIAEVSRTVIRDNDMDDIITGKKTRPFAPFYTKNDHFTKTGSGQT